MIEPDRVVFLPGKIVRHFQTVYRAQNPGQLWVTAMLLEGYEPELYAFSSMDKLLPGLTDSWGLYYNNIRKYMADSHVFDPEEAKFLITDQEMSENEGLDIASDLGVEEASSLVYYNMQITPKLKPIEPYNPIFAFASATEAKEFIKYYNSYIATAMKQIVAEINE